MEKQTFLWQKMDTWQDFYFLTLSMYCFVFSLFFSILDRGSMFVFSNAQFQTIMSVDESWKTGTLLDLGAGDGKVTSVIKHHFDEV